MPEGLKITLLVAVGVAIAFFVYIVLTVPMIAITGPTLILLALVGAFIWIWRASPKETATTREP